MGLGNQLSSGPLRKIGDNPGCTGQLRLSGDIGGRPPRRAETIERTDDGLEGRNKNALIGPHTPADGTVCGPSLDVCHGHGACPGRHRMLRIIVHVYLHPEPRLQPIDKGRNRAIPLARHRARLAIDEEHQRSKTLLVRLFNFIYVFARRVHGFDDFVIEVNPRHVNYYRRLLVFEQAGPERACPRVQGAPAVLLKLDLSIPEREVRRVGGKGMAANERTLYPHFYSWLEEGAVAEFLSRSHRPMPADDARYFGIGRTVHEQSAELQAAGE